jgi:hypothetical protein
MSAVYRCHCGGPDGVDLNEDVLGHPYGARGCRRDASGVWLRASETAGPAPGRQDGAEDAHSATERPATVDSDTMAAAEFTCPACGATTRARMAF